MSGEFSEYFEARFGIQVEGLEPTADLIGLLGIGSLGTIELLLDLEETFHVTFPSDEGLDGVLANVQSLRRFLESGKVEVNDDE